MRERGVGEDNTVRPTGLERKEQSKTVKHNEKKRAKICYKIIRAEHEFKYIHIFIQKKTSTFKRFDVNV